MSHLTKNYRASLLQALQEPQEAPASALEPHYMHSWAPSGPGRSV